MLPEALYWKYPDAVVDCEYHEAWAIVRWQHPTASQPTSEECETIAAEYQAAQTESPDWVQFRAQIVTQAVYFRLVAGHPQNSVLNTLLVQLLFGGGELPEVAGYWNAMVSNVPLTAIEISQLNAVAVACDVPLRLDVQGRMMPIW